MDLANNNFTRVADLDERGVTLERDGKRLKFIPWGEDAEARAAAAAAQETADAAQETADTAQITADTAETKADAAQTAADTADGKAEAAQAAADAAQETADAAGTAAADAASDAAEAQQTANAAVAAAEAAHTAADAAQAAADTADGKAEAAQAAADALEPRVTQLETTASGLQQEVYEAHQEAVQAQTTADAAQTAADTADGKADAAQTAADAAQELADGAVQRETAEGVTEQKAGLKLVAQNRRWQIGQDTKATKWGVTAYDRDGADKKAAAELSAVVRGDMAFGTLKLADPARGQSLVFGYSGNGKNGVPNHVREFDPGTGGSPITLTFAAAICTYTRDLCTFFIGVYTGELQGAQLEVLAAGAFETVTNHVVPGSMLAYFTNSPI